MKHSANLLLILICALFCSYSLKAQNEFSFLKGSYLGQKPPGLKAEMFAPGIISTELHDDAPPVFSSDGKEVYFRIVYKQENTFYSTIFWMRQTDGEWSYPEVAPFSGKYLDGSVTIFPDGKKMIYCTNKGENTSDSYNIDIWQLKRQGSAWINPEKLKTINSPGADFNTCLLNNNVLYWTVEQKMNDPQPKTYCSKIVDSTYSEKEEVSLFPDFTNRVPMLYTFSPDGNYMILTMYRTDFSIDLCVSFKQSDDTWGDPINLGANVNSRYMEKGAGISPDGKYLFFVSNRPHENKNPQKRWNSPVFNNGQKSFGGDIYWVDTEVIEVLRK